ncbi:TatD family hydrolase [Pontibacillus yanchengensis]|uniref:DNAase n=1 Tax=Pontibacillus yanchengensis Y32 TaxID=1385514 RepID=A0A0A2T7W7_9BACI|nr:TatD family hydrolase [Pontibacillus yanchengensis]KGP71857.1 DNAase [Pontibacillus yanchengensis Y32]
MTYPIIDAHIHLDMYTELQQHKILNEMNAESVEALISVSNHYQSALTNIKLSEMNQSVKMAIGYHPEQALPSDQEINHLFELLSNRTEDIIAIGEVGLPYYRRKENQELILKPYIDLLEMFIQISVKLDKPIILHAIYEDADLVIELLEKYNVKKAYFHWFKGSYNTIQRLLKNNYMISITPDCVYEQEIQTIIRHYPMELMMVETDGPWSFEYPFNEEITHPKMIHSSIQKIAEIKQLSETKVYKVMYENTKQFYELDA